MILGDKVPNFEAETTQGPIKLHDYVGDSWTVLFSHPSDFTPVCTSELGSAAKYSSEFRKRGVKLLGLSCNDVESHKQWVKDIEGSMSEGHSLDYPIVADPDRKIATAWGMLDPVEKDDQGRPYAARTVFVIGPDKKLKLSILYPGTTGRNFDELIRVLDSLQLAAKYPIATPANWQPGQEVMILPSCPTEEAKKMFPDYREIEVKSGKAYIRKAKIPEE